jgi:NAD(P)-dependent dehydrogenase (short-subunit alcohol dehydrogenase family)
MLDLTNKQIVVTGGMGFLGAHLVKKLKEHGSDQAQCARSALCRAAQRGLVEVIWLGFHVLPDGRTAHTISRLRVGGAREVLARGVTEKDQA